jgi:hypothetical protein
MFDSFRGSVRRVRQAAPLLIAVGLLAGCASTRNAVPQSVTIKGTPMAFGGAYEPRPQDLTITVNGDPVLRGTFAPYTPTITLEGTHRGATIRAECYFASNVSSRVGFVGRVVATQVQAAQGKAGDECKLFVDSADATTLYF